MLGPLTFNPFNHGKQMTKQNLSAGVPWWHRASQIVHSQTTSWGDIAFDVDDCEDETVDVALRSPMQPPETITYYIHTYWNISSVWVMIWSF